MAQLGVRILTGAIDATDAIARVPRDRWAELVQVRRSFLTTKLPYDCRCLLQFVEEAAPMLGPLGYVDMTDFLRRGLELDPVMVDWALEGLKALKPDDPVPFDVAVTLGRRGRPTRVELATRKGVRNTFTRGSTNAAYLLARLDRDYPEFAARVRAGELKRKTAARLAGIIKTKTPLEQLQRLWAKVSTEDRLAFLRWANTP